MFGHWLTLGALALLPVLTPPELRQPSGPPPGVIPVLDFGDIDLLPVPPAAKGGADAVLVCQAKDPGPGLRRDAAAREAERRYLDEMLTLARYIVQHPEAATWNSELAPSLRNREWVVMYVQAYHDHIEPGPARLGFRRGWSPGAQRCAEGFEPAVQLQITTPRPAGLKLDSVTDYIAWAWTLVVVILPMPESWERTLSSYWIYTVEAWLEWLRPSWFTPAAWAGSAWSWAGGALGWWGGSGDGAGDAAQSLARTRLTAPSQPELFPPAGTARPDYDCPGSVTDIDRLICGDTGVAAADARVAAVFRALQSKLDPGARHKLLMEQSQWVRNRDHAAAVTCGGGGSLDAGCVAALYDRRYELLASALSRADRQGQGRAASPDRLTPQKGPRVLVPQQNGQPSGIY